MDIRIIQSTTTFKKEKQQLKQQGTLRSHSIIAYQGPKPQLNHNLNQLSLSPMQSIFNLFHTFGMVQSLHSLPPEMKQLFHNMNQMVSQLTSTEEDNSRALVAQVGNLFHSALANALQEAGISSYQELHKRQANRTAINQLAEIAKHSFYTNPKNIQRFYQAEQNAFKAKFGEDKSREIILNRFWFLVQEKGIAFKKLADQELMKRLMQGTLELTNIVLQPGESPPSIETLLEKSFSKSAQQIKDDFSRAKTDEEHIRLQYVSLWLSLLVPTVTKKIIQKHKLTQLQNVESIFQSSYESAKESVQDDIKSYQKFINSYQDSIQEDQQELEEAKKDQNQDLIEIYKDSISYTQKMIASYQTDVKKAQTEESYKKQANSFCKTFFATTPQELSQELSQIKFTPFEQNLLKMLPSDKKQTPAETSKNMLGIETLMLDPNQPKTVIAHFNKNFEKEIEQLESLSK